MSHTPTPSALLLAGWGTDPRRLHPLRDALRARDVDAAVWPYHPVGSLADLGAQLRERVASRPGPVHLIGHSLGGLVAARATLDPADADERVASVTTVNTPWRGTWAAYTGSGGLATALRWRSGELRALREALAAHHEHEEDGPRWLLLSALGDLAAPASTALRTGVRGPRLERRVVPVNGHSLSLFSPKVIDAVVDHVTGDEAADVA